MNEPSFQLLLLVIGLLGYALVLSVLRTLAGRVAMVRARHDLLAESKRRRIAFHAELEARRNGGSVKETSDVIIDDDDQYDVIIEDHAPRKAA